MYVLSMVRFILLVGAVLFIPGVFAYQVSPMFHLFEVAGNGSKGAYEISNTGNSEIFVEAVVYSVSFDASGNEQLIPEEEDFLILPPQGKIQAGEARRFRVRYLGDALLPQTKVYRVIFEQIQTSDNTEDDAAKLEFLVDFSTVIFVSPMNCKARVEYRIQGSELVLYNPSSCVYDLNTSQFEFSNSKDSRDVQWSELKPHFAGYLLPKTERRVKLEGQYKGYTKATLLNPL